MSKLNITSIRFKSKKNCHDSPRVGLVKNNFIKLIFKPNQIKLIRDEPRSQSTISKQICSASHHPKSEQSWFQNRVELPTNCISRDQNRVALPIQQDQSSVTLPQIRAKSPCHHRPRLRQDENYCPESAIRSEPRVVQSC